MCLCLQVCVLSFLVCLCLKCLSVCCHSMQVPLDFIAPDKASVSSKTGQGALNSLTLVRSRPATLPRATHDNDMCGVQSTLSIFSRLARQPILQHSLP